MYSLGTALLAVDSWLLLRALRGRPYGRTSWALFGLLALLFSYTHALGLFVLAGQGAFAAGYLAFAPRPKATGDRAARAGSGGTTRAGRQLRWALGVAAALAVGCIPLLLMLGEKADGVTWSLPLRPQAIADETALTLVSTFAAPLALDPLVAWGLTAAVLAVHVQVVVRWGWPGWFLALAGLAPALMMLGHSYLSGRSIFFARYLTFAHVYALAAVALFAISLRPAPRWALLAGLAAAWLLVCYPAGWKVVGPAANPGMRAAVEEVLTRRGPDEPILAQRPITLVKALYYLRGRARPRLWVSVPSHSLQAQGPWLNDDELIPTGEVLSLEVPGVWVLSTSWYGETPAITFPLPGHWRLEETFAYPQDYPGEGPVMVYHFRAQE
jgi:hypothetical protein